MVKQVVEQQMQERLIRLKEVLQIVPVSKSSWWAGIQKGVYPKGRKLTEKTTVWVYSEIMAIVDSVKQQEV